MRLSAKIQKLIKFFDTTFNKSVTSSRFGCQRRPINPSTQLDFFSVFAFDRVKWIVWFNAWKSFDSSKWKEKNIKNEIKKIEQNWIVFIRFGKFNHLPMRFCIEKLKFMFQNNMYCMCALSWAMSHEQLDKWTKKIAFDVYLKMKNFANRRKMNSIMRGKTAPLQASIILCRNSTIEFHYLHIGAKRIQCLAHWRRYRFVFDFIFVPTGHSLKSQVWIAIFKSTLSFSPFFLCIFHSNRFSSAKEISDD